MLFNSYEFLFIFLPLALAGFFILNKLKLPLASRLYLLGASLFFYSYWNPCYIFLILLSIVVNYTVCQGLWRGQKNKKILSAGIIFNVLLLGTFKYTDMFIETVNLFTGAGYSLLNIVLPLAISFFTFQQIACLVDAYRGNTKPCTFYDYALFVSFFPQLIAGPIVHYGEMIPQLQRLRTFVFNPSNISIGLSFLFMGLFKKTIMADGIAVYVSPVFEQASAYGHSLTLLEAWGGALAFTFQIYFDFSGYSDIAIGLARLFNIKIPVNFNSPYKSLSFQEFWSRWHITLSRFLTTYLYIPLGGNRVRIPRQLLNVMITMLLAGLWHGAGWTYVCWGGMMGGLILINRLWKKVARPLPVAAAWFLTFFTLIFTMAMFRAPDFNTAIEVYKGMIGINGIALSENLFAKWGFLGQLLADHGVVFTNMKPFWKRNDEIKYLLFCLFFVTALPNSQEIIKRYFKPDWIWAILTAIVAVFGVLGLSRVSEFIYFRF